MPSPAPSSNPTSPPPTSVPSSPPPSTNSTAPPPSTPSAPPPSTPSAPPPSTPSAPPPSTPSAPSPSTPSAPPPSTPSAPPPTTPSSPPPTIPSAPPPSTPTAPLPSPSPSPPAPSTPLPSPPSPSPPAPSTPTISPPSPPSGKSPPSARSPPPPPHSPSSSSSLPTTAVVGIAVGAVVIVALLSILCFCCRKKRRRTRPSGDYYGGAPPVHMQQYEPYGGAQHHNWQNNAPPPAGLHVKIPPQPPAPLPYASRPPIPPTGYSSTPPPPQPPMFSSSGGSGYNYSGSENPLPPPPPPPALGFSKSIFTFEELAMATNGFSDANLVGQGGFGYVHKGMLPNGKEVAIKQLKLGSGQGEREFQAEIETISRVHHRHLVSLVGYCMSGSQRLLVYEFVPNQTLEFHLHEKDRPTMDWPTRLKIALGSAKGLAYLHEDCHPKIIHRDIKATNILLDFKFEAMVADFGLAKFASDNNTHVSTRVMGTFGYLAPEYASSGKLTDRSDVFSFGVMLLELITGRQPVDSNQIYMDDSLVDWARPLLTRALEDGNYETLVDPRLGRNYNPNEMARMIACAASCVRHSARRRPMMSQIVRALEGDVSLEDLNDGIEPGHSTLYSSHGSSDNDSTQYNEDMKKFRKMALAGRDYTSSENSAPTSEYGQIPSASSGEDQQTREMEMAKMKKDSQGFSSS